MTLQPTVNSSHDHVTCRDKTCPYAQYGHCGIQNTLTFFLYVEVAFHREVICSFMFLRISSDLVHELLYLWPCPFKTISCLKRDSKNPLVTRVEERLFLAEWNHTSPCWACTARLFMAGGYREGLCKVIEASSVSHGASTRQFYDRAALGQGWAISDHGRASGITYLRGKSTQCQRQ